MAEEWYSPGRINFNKEQMIWLIKNLSALRDGYWPLEPGEGKNVTPEGGPDKKVSGYGVEMTADRKSRVGGPAYYEAAMFTLAQVEARLFECGLDGLILEAFYCWGVSTQRIAKAIDVTILGINRRIQRALNYVQGKPKKTTYKEFCDHKKPKLRREVREINGT